MALAESSTRSAAGAAAGEWLQRIHPAWALVALILIIMPAIANGFVLVQIFAWSFMLGTIALSLMFLAGYGGMVSLAQMTIAGFAGYMVAIFGVNGLATPQHRLAVVAGDADGASAGDDFRRHHRRASRAHRRHLHDHDHARDRVGVLLFHQRELRPFQRAHRHQQRSDAAVSGRRLEGCDSLLLPDAWRRGPLLLGGRLCRARAVRAGAAGDSRQSAPHGGARLQRLRPSRRGLCVRRPDRGARRRAAGLEQRRDRAWHGQRLGGDRHPRHRRRRRASPTQSGRSSAL